MRIGVKNPVTTRIEQFVLCMKAGFILIEEIWHRLDRSLSLLVIQQGGHSLSDDVILEMCTHLAKAMSTLSEVFSHSWATKMRAVSLVPPQGSAAQVQEKNSRGVSYLE